MIVPLNVDVLLNVNMTGSEAGAALIFSIINVFKRKVVRLFDKKISSPLLRSRAQRSIDEIPFPLSSYDNLNLF